MGKKRKSSDPGLTALVISYVPLLSGPPGVALEPASEAASGLAEMVDSLPSGAALACLWFIRDGRPVPVLVFEDMRAVVDHLEWWAEGKPAEWLELKIVRRGGKYAVALIPRVKRSIERWGVAYQLRTGFPPPETTKYNVIFRALHFVSGSKNTFDSVADSLGPETEVGFVDLADIDRENPGSVDDSKVRMLGPFPVSQDPAMDPYVESIIDGAEEPSGGLPFRP